METMVISFVLGIVNHFIKNPAHKAQYKSQLLALRDAIDNAYPEAKS
jgi:hypothetical protein